VTDFEIRDLPEQLAVVRRGRVPMPELKQFFDETFRRLWQAIEEQGVTVAGPPFARYNGMPGEWVDLEAGFPIAGAFAGHDDLVASTLPACRAVVGVHAGTYETLGSTWLALQEWAAEQGLRSRDEFWECYVSDPGEVRDPDDLRTELVQPVDPAP
jgi:effector-binding domain-containing protein